MSWFEEWWKEQCLKRIGNKQPMYIAEAAYKAALEKAVESLTPYIDTEEWINNLLDEIKEQINGE